MEDSFMKCGCCGEMFDMRDLSQVGHHGFDMCAEIDKVKDLGNYNSKKVGEPVEYLKNKDSVNLN